MAIYSNFPSHQPSLFLRFCSRISTYSKRSVGKKDDGLTNLFFLIAYVIHPLPGLCLFSGWQQTPDLLVTSRIIKDYIGSRQYPLWNVESEGSEEDMVWRSIKWEIWTDG